MLGGKSEKVGVYRFQNDGAMGNRVEGEYQVDAELGCCWVWKDLLLSILLQTHVNKEL